MPRQHKADKLHSRHRSRREYRESEEVATYMLDGPKTPDEIADHLRSYIRRLGLFNVTERLDRADKRERLMRKVQETLDDLLAQGWAVRQGERYALTESGREEARRMLADVRQVGARLGELVLPETVSKVSLAVHLGLAALKLPAGLLSGSVGLLNDAADTLLDGLSSLLVYAGIRFDKERVVSVVLVLLMLVTGGFTFYEAVRRFFTPFEPEVDGFTFLATILSALVCLALYFYQRFVGLRGGSMALITQSVDSRNHVIVAASVTAGLIASLLQFPFLDTLVGLAVAVLILKSAVELAVELVRSLGEEDVDLSRYKIGLAEQYEQFRQAQLRDWMLYLVQEQGVQTRAELLTRARQALDFGDNPVLQELGLAERPQADEMIEQNLAELFERGWLAEPDRLTITDAGKERLRQRKGRTRWEMHRLSPGH
jgi:cation diffusion facilitator family transporter